MIYGTGLIGGSVGMALTRRGWQVSGIDVVPTVAKRAVALGAIAEVGEDHSAELVVVATPVHVAAEVVGRVLSGPYRAEHHRDRRGQRERSAGRIDRPSVVRGWAPDGRL